MKYKELTRQLIKLIGICALVAICINVAGVSVAEAGINEKKAKKTPIASDESCGHEKGIKFKGGDNTRLSTEEIEDLLTGNTYMSVTEKWGAWAVYFPSNKKTVGWSPNEIKKKGTWSRGTVTFENDKYCRQWKAWESGKKIKCWEIHRGDDVLDLPSFYAVCADGTPAGGQAVVFPGNYFNVKVRGASGEGTIKQDTKNVKDTLKKFF